LDGPAGSARAEETPLARQRRMGYATKTVTVAPPGGWDKDIMKSVEKGQGLWQIPDEYKEDVMNKLDNRPREKLVEATGILKGMLATIEAEDWEAVGKTMSSVMPTLTIALPLLRQESGAASSGVLMANFYDNLDDFSSRMIVPGGFGSGLGSGTSRGLGPMLRSYKAMIICLDGFSRSLDIVAPVA